MQINWVYRPRGTNIWVLKCLWDWSLLFPVGLLGSSFCSLSSNASFAIAFSDCVVMIVLSFAVTVSAFVVVTGATWVLSTSWTFSCSSVVFVSLLDVFPVAVFLGLFGGDVKSIVLFTSLSFFLGLKVPRNLMQATNCGILIQTSWMNFLILVLPVLSDCLVFCSGDAIEKFFRRVDGIDRYWVSQGCC